MSDTLAGESLNLFNRLSDPNVRIVAHLCKNPIADDADKVALTDLVECDFVGYLPVRLTEWSYQETGEDWIGEAVNTQMEFVAGDLIDAQVVYGEYITVSLNNGPTFLLRFNLLDTLIVIDVKGMVYKRQLRITSADIPE